MRFAPHSVSRSGFTLIELVISAALMSMVLTGAYLCLNAALASQKVIEPRADAIQTGRVILAMMADDIRGACSAPKAAPFLGVTRVIGDVQADNLDFATHRHSPKGEGEADFCEVSYFLQRNPGDGGFSLWRRRNPIFAPDPLSGGKREELATGVRGLGFEYYDGIDWFDNWGEMAGKTKVRQADALKERSNLSGFPEAVRITLSLDVATSKAGPPEEVDGATREPPMVFQTVVKIEAPTESSSGGRSGASGTGKGSAPR